MPVVEPSERIDETAATPAACAQCGYDLSGLPVGSRRCPECGEPALAHRARAAATRQFDLGLTFLVWGLPLCMLAWLLHRGLWIRGGENNLQSVQFIPTLWTLLYPALMSVLVGFAILSMNPITGGSARLRAVIHWLCVIAVLAATAGFAGRIADVQGTYGSLRGTVSMVRTFIDKWILDPACLLLVMTAPALLAAHVRRVGLHRLAWLLGHCLTIGGVLAGLWLLRRYTRSIAMLVEVPAPQPVVPRVTSRAAMPGFQPGGLSPTTLPDWFTQVSFGAEWTYALVCAAMALGVWVGALMVRTSCRADCTAV